MDHPDHVQSPSVVVFGVGAVGGFYGAKLIQAGAKVTMACRSDYEAIKSRGLTIHSIDGDFKVTPHRVTYGIVAEDTPPDYILICVKQLPEIDLAKQIKPLLGEETTIVLLQNGIDIESRIAQALPQHELISGLAFVCLSRKSPGVIDHLCFGRLAFGNYPRGISKKTQNLAALFKKVSIPCHLSENIGLDRWKKLIWNAPFNPISVLAAGADTREMMDTPEIRDLASQVMREVILVARAEGYAISDDAVEKNLAATDKMKPYKTSMLLDYQSGRAMEVDAILGHVIQLAGKHQLKTPFLKSLYALLKLTAQKMNLQGKE
ncbi:ketopantoate reductase family protein [Magnetococcales bacterium HHB-1]